MDQTKKTMRHFYCRDVLWETFEAMANDFDCSIDYLVNESMRLYARSKNYQVPAAGASPSQIIPSGAGGMGGGNSGTMNRPAIGTPSPSALRSTSTSQQLPRPVTSPAVVQAPRPPAPMMATTPRAVAALPPTPPAPPPPAPHTPHTPHTPPPPPLNQSQSFSAANAVTPAKNLIPTSPPSNWSPPLSASSAGVGGESGSALLYLMFNGQRFVVDKEQFVIGRGSKTADLPIKDGNISRQHAVVLRRNGVYYIKDLGSTNGIEYKGMRIDNKRIDEGDTFYICDYELKFTYQPQRG